MSARVRLIVPALAVVAACTFAVAPSAGAKDRGSGGGGTPPVPAATDPCAPVTGTVYADGTVASDFNEYGIIGGCAVIVFGDDFRATVYQVLPEPGWTSELDVRDGSNGTRVTVTYTEDASGHKTSLRVEPGKTVVKQ
jgi:hypothetical protein